MDRPAAERLKRAGSFAMAGGTLRIRGPPFTVGLLLTQPTIAAFFSGPWVAWPIGSGVVSTFLGYRAVKAGLEARRGIMLEGGSLRVIGFVGIFGAAVIMGGLLGFIGGVLVLAAASLITRLQAAANE